MKAILIPVDFSSVSKKALQVGARIAKRIKGKIVLTHMAGLENGLSKASDNFEDAIYQSKLIGKKFEDFINEPFMTGICVEPILQKHLNFNSVSELAVEIEACLIVMGSQGSYGISEVFKGSNTQKVVRRSEIPVLVVKDNAIDFLPERILYVSDFKEETISAYHRIIEVGTMLGIRIEFLYVNTPSDGFKSTKEIDAILTNFFAKVDYAFPEKVMDLVHRYADYSVEEGIMNYMALKKTDIIAIATHGRTGLAHLVHGSISEDVANHAQAPVLTVKM